MKLKHIVLIFLLSFAIDFVGTWMKLTHRDNADTVMAIGLGFKLLAILLAVIKLLKAKNFKAFLSEE